VKLHTAAAILAKYADNPEAELSPGTLLIRGFRHAVRKWSWKVHGRTFSLWVRDDDQTVSFAGSLARTAHRANVLKALSQYLYRMLARLTPDNRQIYVEERWRVAGRSLVPDYRVFFAGADVPRPSGDLVGLCRSALDTGDWQALADWLMEGKG
jgi:hypothetical protein